jgi:hypothetical protein
MSMSQAWLGYFGLREPPFALTPDTGFFFATRAIATR